MSYRGEPVHPPEQPEVYCSKYHRHVCPAEIVEAQPDDSVTGKTRRSSRYGLFVLADGKILNRGGAVALCIS
jgi:hypothetical protein